MLKPIMTALTGWKGYVAAFALGAALAGPAAGVAVWKVRDGMEAAAKVAAAQAQTKAAQAVVRRTDRAAVVTQDVGRAVETARGEARIEYRTIIERIPVYVTPETDRSVIVPVGFVRLHDAAAGGDAAALPDGAGEPADAPSGVALSAVAATVVGNYETCADDRARLIGWQTWYAEQKAAWEKPDD